MEATGRPIARPRHTSVQAAGRLRRSGEPRTTPLLYTPLEDAFIVVASKAGADHHPAWYHNIRAHPDAVSIEVDGRRVAVRPRIVDGPERSELWQRVNDNYNGYETYARRAGARVIPLVVLDPGN